MQTEEIFDSSPIPVCHLCGGSKTQKVKTIPSSLLIDRWKDWLKINIQDELKGTESVALHRCKSCELGFFMPQPLAGSPKLYEELFRREEKDYYPQDKWEFKTAARDLKGSKKVLEVGSGSGEFLKIALSQSISIEGIELNQKSVTEAQAEGLPMKHACLYKLAETKPESYDAVCSFQVLEHIENPKKFIEACCRLLKPGGKLIFATPNSSSFLKYTFNLLDLPPHHVTQWGSNTFLSLEKIFPLRTQYILQEPLLRKHVREYIDGKIAQYRIPRRLFRPSLIRLTVKAVQHTGLHQWLKGHSLYAYFTKSES